MKKYYIETYGCEMNKSDSLDIARSFDRRGYVQVFDPAEADVVVINTCAVREHAENRIYGRLGYYRNLVKRKKENAETPPVIVLAGCLAQQRGRGIVDNFPEVSVVAGTYYFCEIPHLVEEACEKVEPVIRIDFSREKLLDKSGESLINREAENFSVWVPIIRGCSNFCSYCIVPYLRGPEISRPSGEIIEEIKRLAERGVVEVKLLGQNVNAYGKDSGDISFAELLTRINEIDGIEWIRFLTSHPKDFAEESIKRIASLDKVCRHIHLPLQSGSNRILKLMNRKYTVERYLELVDFIRDSIPECSITTDIIVGFPGEEEVDFEETLKIIHEVKFDDAFTYRYSERPFTKAASIKEKVDPSVAARRLEVLIEEQRKISHEKNIEKIGKRGKALVERTSKKNKNEYLCKMEDGRMVIVPTDKNPGEFIEVKVTGIVGNTLVGEEIGLKIENEVHCRTS